MKASPYYPALEKLNSYEALRLEGKMKRSTEGPDKHNFYP